MYTLDVIQKSYGQSKPVLRETFIEAWELELKKGSVFDRDKGLQVTRVTMVNVIGIVTKM